MLTVKGLGGEEPALVTVALFNLTPGEPNVTNRASGYVLLGRHVCLMKAQRKNNAIQNEKVATCVLYV